MTGEGDRIDAVIADTELRSHDRGGSRMATANASLPPQPSIPPIVQTLRFMRDPFSLIADATREHGDVFSLRLLGLGTWVMVGSPRLLKRVFTAPPDVLAAGVVNRQQLGFMLGGDATFCLDAEAHRQRQRLVFPHLNGRSVDAYVELVRRLSEDAIARWPLGRPFALLSEGHRLSLQVLIELLFGGSEPERRRRLLLLFERFATRGLRSLPIALPWLRIDLGRFSPWGRVLELRRTVRREFAEEIGRRWHQPLSDDGVGDLLSVLAHSRQTDGGRLSEEALLDETINLLFAGHETTGNVLTWCIHALLTHPEVRQRLRAELEEVTGGRPVTASHLPQLPYLEAVIHESLRFRPIAPMAGIRRVERPFALDDYLLPPGTIVAQCFPAMCRRADLFHHPDRFDPEHFLGRKLKPPEWNPFGGGARTCLGRGLAEMELKVIVATLEQRAQLRLAQRRVRPVRSALFFTPNRGMRVVLESRREGAAVQ